VHPERRVGGAQAGGERALEVARGVPVAGHRSGRRGRALAVLGLLLEHSRARGVEAAPLTRQQLRVGSFANELVPEREPPVALFEQVVRHCVAQRRRELGGG
jgi:hypothetical protein